MTGFGIWLLAYANHNNNDDTGFDLTIRNPTDSASPTETIDQ